MQSAIETSSHTGPAPRYSNETVDARTALQSFSCARVSLYIEVQGPSSPRLLALDPFCLLEAESCTDASE